MRIVPVIVDKDLGSETLGKLAREAIEAVGEYTAPEQSEVIEALATGMFPVAMAKTYARILPAIGKENSLNPLRLEAGDLWQISLDAVSTHWAAPIIGDKWPEFMRKVHGLSQNPDAMQMVANTLAAFLTMCIQGCKGCPSLGLCSADKRMEEVINNFLRRTSEDSNVDEAIHIIVHIIVHNCIGYIEASKKYQEEKVVLMNGFVERSLDTLQEAIETEDLRAKMAEANSMIPDDERDWFDDMLFVMTLNTQAAISGMMGMEPFVTVFTDFIATFKEEDAL